MADRSLWFESHLLGDRAGRRARAACARLGAATHEQMLRIGDQLASTSSAVAQQFYRNAAPVWDALGPDDFTRWVALGEGLLTTEPGLRDAALAFFSVAPTTIARAGIHALTSWCATGRRVAVVSRRLAASFFEGSRTLLATTSADTIAEWARHGVRLYGEAGWRGEFLAQAYFAATAEVVPLLEAHEFATWADLGVRLQPALKESRFFAALPNGLGTFKVPERTLFFATAKEIAATYPQAAAAFYTQLPPSIRRLHATSRLALLQAFRYAAPALGDALKDTVPVVGALVHDLPAAHRHAALALVLTVARQFPRGTLAVLRSLPVAYEDARHPAVEHWVQRGLEIAAQNAEAGVAYFGLESRTSVKVLHASSTAATLADVQGLLRKYVQMLSGRPVSIRTADVFALRAPLEEFPLENEIALPAKIDVFVTHEDNARLYRFLAAQLAGRRECGTYSVTLPAHAAGLVAWLRAPQHPQLLEELFLVTEGFRVAAAMARTYAGLANEQRVVAALVLARQPEDSIPSQSGLLDALFMALLCGREHTAVPVWLRPLVGLAAPAVAPLAAREATADDALAIARMLTAQLAEPHEPRGHAAGDAYLDKLGGDALIDPYFDDEGPTFPGETSAGLDSAPLPPPSSVPDVELQLQPEVEDVDGVAAPLSAEELERLIEAGVDLRIKQGYSDDLEGLGLYITDLLGKMPPERLAEVQRLLHEALPRDRPAPRRWLEARGEGASFYYDEWDYHIADYRQRWCRLREVPVDGDAGEFFNRALLDYATLIPEVRRQFQRIRPEMYRTIRGLEDGEDFDLNAVVNARVDRRARRPPSTKLYVARTREERDVATLFLIDMSASTDEPLQRPAAEAPEDTLAAFQAPGLRPARQTRRIIDVTKEALVIMAEALEEIGDAYAIYGFSGHGRLNVEFYLVKSFSESLSAAVKGRIGALEPKRSTRMGTALRHATEKMASISSRSRHIILLSDGFPQDFDYGQDRRSNTYGLRDTTIALREVEAAGITPFCITVDKAGHDYLREMCDGARYMVIEDIAALPRELPKIYQRVVTV